MYVVAVGSMAGWTLGDSAAGLATLALAVTLGQLLGAIRVRGVRLGISGVLFAALLFGQVGLTVDAKVLAFLSDFALITSNAPHRAGAPRCCCLGPASRCCRCSASPASPGWRCA